MAFESIFNCHHKIILIWLLTHEVNPKLLEEELDHDHRHWVLILVVIKDLYSLSF